MINGINNLLLNLLFILITLAIHQLWVEGTSTSDKAKKLSIFVTSGIGILLCMVFSFYQRYDIQFDLRRIPFWFGTLYGGPIIGFLLTLETIVISMIQTKASVLTTTINTSLLFLLTLFLRPYYFNINRYKKVIVGVGINLMFSIIILVLATYNFSIHYHQTIWIEFIAINLAGIILVSLSIEAIRKNYLIRMRLFHSARLETVSHLAAAVNHEIKNPLTAVRGLVQLLDPEQDFTKEKRKEFKEIALNEIDKIDRVITDYLTFARPYSNYMERIDASKAINDAIDVIYKQASESGVQIHVDPADVCYIKCYPTKLIQSFINILQNSIDALPNGGSISIKLIRNGTYCDVHILDTGLGMSKEVLDRLGEPFFSINSNGTGIGMMVVYQVIEKINGHLKINSKPGVGTEVVVSIPVDEAE